MNMNMDSQNDNRYTNPFFVPIEGSNLRFVKTKVLAEEYGNHLYILCLAANFVASVENKSAISSFHDPHTSLSNLVKHANLLAIVQAPMFVAKKENIRFGLVRVPLSVLKTFGFNFSNFNLIATKSSESSNQELIVFLMLESTDVTINSWLHFMYNDKNSLEKFIGQKIFISYYGLSDPYSDDKLLNLVRNADNFNYWQSGHNCNMAINNSFAARKFNIQLKKDWRILSTEEKQLGNILRNFNEVKRDHYNGSGYPAKILDKNYPKKSNSNFNRDNFNKNKFNKNKLDKNKSGDASALDERSIYYLVNTDKLPIGTDSITELLLGRTLSHKEKFYLLCNLISSKNYCHYILNNGTILNSCKDIFEKYKPLFRYLIGYAWATLYTEEQIKRTKICQTDRYVFDLNSASNLPVFPFDQQSPHMNPYFSLFVAQDLLQDKNIHGVKQCISYQNGIVDLPEFKNRINIFMSGNPDIDLLAGANWNNMALTGGCMAAILPKTNPLMGLFNADNNIQPDQKVLDRFFSEYYANSDIDVACNHNTMIEFIDHVIHLKDTIKTSLSKITTNPQIDIKPLKSVAIYIDATILRKKCEMKQIPFAFDHIIENKNKHDVKHYFYELYMLQKKISNKQNKQIIGQKININEYFEIINLSEFANTTIIIGNMEYDNNMRLTELNNEFNNNNDNDIQLVYYIDENGNQLKPDMPGSYFIKFSESIKYKIDSKSLKHSFEVFRIRGKEFFSSISRFHLPCVRSYYNGQNCYMLPSAITAYHTLTNIDFKYFVGKHDPINILDKYRKRGYGTILNSLEIKQYLSYVFDVDKCKQAYAIKDETDLQKIVGAIDVNDSYFKPRLIMPEDFTCDPNISTKYNTFNGDECVGDGNDIIRYYANKYPKYPAIILQKKTIDATGHIAPLAKWIIDASYDFAN